VKDIADIRCFLPLRRGAVGGGESEITLPQNGSTDAIQNQTSFAAEKKPIFEL